ncbi:hypothetical protein BCR33DRAFT_720527 [Rhizoclosmatium globosum]|uniref:Uncharacterized protein n=1 Tax=Rhizoclosmatium globosum TaxID=329046 RepID=A0A1Y2BW22_9FUNG|nr:hypothetical protein BCR33DRAFT_720527 [Rhizoclosmatium globosum]|eukprot:ORY38874.1 hypothetical protein BCR33DRAFT_720527 [Rhizoclosmatium globosum]
MSAHPDNTSWPGNQNMSIISSIYSCLVLLTALSQPLFASPVPQIDLLSLTSGVFGLPVCVQQCLSSGTGLDQVPEDLSILCKDLINTRNIVNSCVHQGSTGCNSQEAATFNNWLASVPLDSVCGLLSKK